MHVPVSVQIIGAPIACKEGIEDSWRAVAEYTARQLKARFDGSVEVHYFDLFDPDSPSIPPNVQLPLVLVNGEVLSSGGKISTPMIRSKIETIQGTLR